MENTCRTATQKMIAHNVLKKELHQKRRWPQKITLAHSSINPMHRVRMRLRTQRNCFNIKIYCHIPFLRERGKINNLCVS